MSQTSRLGLSYPDPLGTDDADVPLWMHDLAVELDAIIPPTSHGPLASRPTSSVGAPGLADRLYFATDVDPETIADAGGVNGVLYRDTGTGWQAIGPFGSKVAAGTFTPPVIAGNFDITGIGFAAKLVEFTYHQTTDSDTNTTFGLGWATSPTNRFASFMRASSTLSGVYQRRQVTNRCIYEIDNNGTLIMAADYVQALASGFRLNFITAPSATSHIVAWKAWG